MKAVRALVLTGYGLNCDYETDFSLKIAGANSERLHINELLGASKAGARIRLDDYHILVFGGGFSWADDHGAGVIMATRLRYNIGEEIEEFIGKGKLILGICNGFQALVNFGLLPGINGDYRSRRVAITYNDSGNFINTWIKLKVLEDSRCVFTRGISALELPVRHGEAPQPKRLALRYCRHLRLHGQDIRPDAPPRGLQSLHKPPRLGREEGATGQGGQDNRE